MGCFCSGSSPSVTSSSHVEMGSGGGEVGSAVLAAGLGSGLGAGFGPGLGAAIPLFCKSHLVCLLHTLKLITHGLLLQLKQPIGY